MRDMLEAAARAVATANGFRYTGDSIIEHAEHNPRSAHFVGIASAVMDVVLPMEREACIALAKRAGETECESRGPSDPETGEIPCGREARGDDCLCVARMEFADTTAMRIRARAAHPDVGGSDGAMAALNKARAEALAR